MRLYFPFVKLLLKFHGLSAGISSILDRFIILDRSIALLLWVHLWLAMTWINLLDVMIVRTLRVWIGVLWHLRRLWYFGKRWQWRWWQAVRRKHNWRIVVWNIHYLWHWRGFRLKRHNIWLCCIHNTAYFTER
jgi:hypothetical protein